LKKIYSIDDLKLDKLNANKGTDEGRKLLKSSIESYGFGRSILVDKDGNVIAGNKTLEKAKELNLPVKVVNTDGKEIIIHQRNDLSIESKEGRELSIVDNRSSQIGLDWDAETMNSLDVIVDWEKIGFSKEDIDEIMASIEQPFEGLTDPDDIPEDVETKCKTGDLWELGRHRVLCGDATDADAVDRLMEGNKADMVFTDPPYRMDAEGGSNQPIGKAAAKLGESIKHLCDFDPIKFLEIINMVFKNKQFNAYIFCNKDLVPDYLNWSIKKGYAFNILFWKKPNAIPLGGQHRPDIEYLLLFRKSAIWNNGLSNVNYSKCLEYDRESFFDHPTMKPVDLICNEIKLSSFKDSIVFDFFLGSGSTLIAAEKTIRICYGMEIEPHYCDVIIQRWEDFTGKEAKQI